MARYPGAGSHLKFTSNLDFVDPQRYDGIPVYRVSSPDGRLINPDEDPKVWIMHLIDFHLSFCRLFDEAQE